MNKKLPVKIKQKWVEALRSGKYKQTKGELKNGQGFCCLGVACEIGLTKRRYNGDDLVQFKFLDNEIQNKLATYNDNGKSFNWIANYINKYL